MKQELIYEFPSQLAETYNDICSGLEKYDFSKVKKQQSQIQDQHKMDKR